MRPLVLVVALTVLVAGCSAGSDGHERLAVDSSSSDCDFKEITAGRRLEGTCEARGVGITVVNRASWLHGKEYDARIEGLRVASTLPGGSRARGRFVVVTLSVKNTLGAPQEFNRRSNLAFLLIGGKYFSEDPDAESVAALKPFRLRRAALQPDEAATGTVVFDVPEAHAKNVDAQGSSLILVNYSDAEKQFPTGTEPLGALGYIRTWK